MEKSKRNGAIDFWKFAFSIMIVLFHSYYFANNIDGALFREGRIAVEFFFIVSGYFMARSALKKELSLQREPIGKETIGFILQKIKSFTPDYFIAFFVAFTVRQILEPKPFWETFKSLASSVWELLFIFMTGLKGYQVNGATWYLSAMLISMTIIYPILRKNSDKFLNIYAPLISFLILGYLFQVDTGLAGVYDWLGFVYKGLLRAIAEICLGVFCFNICEKLKDLDFTKLTKIVLAVLEVVGYVGTFVWAYKEKPNDEDYLIVLLIALSVTISMSRQSAIYPLFDKKIFSKLAAFSFPLYLSHHYWAQEMENIMPNSSYYQRLPVYLVIVAVNSVCLFFLSNLIKKKKLKNKTALNQTRKSWFINEKRA